MAIVVPDQGLVVLACNALGASGGRALGGLLIDLYSNNYQPDHTTTLANFVLPTFDGYGQAFVSISNMVATLIPGAEVTLINGQNPVNWVNSGFNTIVYGYLVRDGSGSTVLWCEYWGPVNLNYKCTLSFNLELDVS